MSDLPREGASEGCSWRVKRLVGGVSSAGDTLRLLLPSNAWARPAAGPAWLNLSFSSLSLKINFLTPLHRISVDFSFIYCPRVDKALFHSGGSFPKHAGSVSHALALDAIVAEPYSRPAWGLTVIGFF